MKGRLLTVFVLLGLAVAGYAVYTLSEGRERSAARTTSVRKDAKPAKDGRASATRKAKPADPAAAPAEPRPEPEPEPESEPAADEPSGGEEEQLRQRIADLMAEIDGEIERVGEGGGIERERWVDFYTRGNSEIGALARLLALRGPESEGVEEIVGFHDELRHRLDKIKPQD